MNLSIFIIIAGCVLLFVPQYMWVGLAFLGIGAVIYTLGQREPLPIACGQPKYMQASRQRAGFSWSVKSSPGERQEGTTVKDGMLNLPLPIDPAVGQFLNLNYKMPTKANVVTQGFEKKRNPFLPEI